MAEVQAAMESAQIDGNKGVERDIEDMIQGEAGSLFTRHARVLVYINTSALLAGAVWLGIYIQRFSEVERRQADLDARIQRVANVEKLDAQIVVLTLEVNRLRDRLERLLDDGALPHRGRNRE